MRLLLLSKLVLSLNVIVGAKSLSDSDSTEQTTMKVKAKSSYKTSEKIEKAPSEDHPCNLTRTTMRISFPSLKSELLVNILGYKEPNLVELWQCKGYCGESSSPVACSPTQVRPKVVSMMFQSNYSAGKDSKTDYNELILDEHVDCGCKCSPYAKYDCAGVFNELTCECKCEGPQMAERRTVCDSDTSTYWDPLDCNCKTKGVAPRGIDSRDTAPCRDGRHLSGFLENNPSLLQGDHHYLAVGYVCLGGFITVSIFLTATTVYYRKKLKNLKISKMSSEQRRMSTGRERDADFRSVERKSRLDHKKVDGLEESEHRQTPRIHKKEKCPSSLCPARTGLGQH